MVTFQQAYEAAAARYTQDDWVNMNPSRRNEVIYEEMRRLDAESVMVDAHLSDDESDRSNGHGNGWQHDKRPLPHDGIDDPLDSPAVDRMDS